MIDKIRAFFTPAKRKAIYGLVAAGSIALVAFGVVSQDQLDSAVATAVSAITALTTLMAFINTSPSPQKEEDPEDPSL